MSTPAGRFLVQLYGGVPAKMFILAWTLQERRSAWYRADRLHEAAAYVASVGQRADLYIGCGLRRRDHGVHARGESADVIAIVGAWADVDVAKPGATKPYFKTRADAAMFLDALPIRPTMRIWTGAGYHAWWCFREPWIFAADAERAEAATLLRRWQVYLRTRAAGVGATIDATHDLARVLRPAGTINHKWNQPVALETADGPRCNPSDLEDLGGDLLPDDEPTVHHAAGPDIHFRLDQNASPPPVAFVQLCARHPRFARTWRRERDDLRDRSGSGYDQALASIAARAGWTDQDIVDLLIAHRRQHGNALKLRADYYVRTLRRARTGRVAR